MKYVLNGKQMKDCDLAVINGSIEASLALIDKASSACIKHLYNEDFDLNSCLIVCGGGNNGADGFAIAEKLINDNYSVKILIPDKSLRFSKEAEILMNRIDCEIIAYDDFILNYSGDNFTVIVDAVFGIGLSREVVGNYAKVIEFINESKAKVLSVDIPSGVSSDNGMIMKAAVNADVTVTFACLKNGQLLYPGKAFCGKLVLEDIGIPWIESEQQKYCVTDMFDDKNYLPPRKPYGNKGTFGKILVVAGSANIFGAAYLSAMAAYKCGCGMVHILTEKNNLYSMQQLLPEALIHCYDENDTNDAVEQLKRLMEICDVICVGCGIGMGGTSVNLVKAILDSEKPTVLDADALNIIAKENLLPFVGKGNCILTPHIMEMSRLCKISCDNIKDNPVNCAQSFADEHNVVLVMKDAVTVVATPDSNTYINRTGNCAMAKAGSGDVLAGMIAGILGQNKDLRNSACLGVYLHGLIGDRQVVKTGEYSLLARNLLEGIEELNI